MRLRGTFTRAALVALIALAPAGCTYSSYQSAKMLPRGGSSVTGAFTSYGYHEGGDSADESAIEVMGSHGLSEVLEMGGKLAWFNFEGGNAFNILAVPKYSLMPDQLALTVPAGIIFITEDDPDADTNNVWMLAPGVVYTLTLSPDFDLNLGAKPVFTFADDFSDYNIAGAVNVGIRLQPAGMRFSITPELGIMYDDDSSSGSDETGYFLQIGFAFGYEFGPQRAAATAAPGTGTGN